MLDYIRSNTQSFGVKVAFGVIILVFVFWGVGSISDSDTSHVLAKVNDEPILETQFYKRFQRVESQLMQRGMTREAMKAEQLGRQVLQDMIAHSLVRQEAKRLGLEITPLELRLAIEQNPLFHNDKGKLDKESYTRGLDQLRMRAADFEDELREELLFEKMLSLVTAEVWLAPNSAKSRYDFLFEKRNLGTIFVRAQDYVDKVEVTKDDIKNYYDGHKDSFTIPKKVKLSYIALDPNKLVDPTSISASDIENYYKRNLTTYTQHEAVNCAHILVPLSANADAKAKEEALATIKKIQEALQKGQSFAELANKYNPANAAGKDGDLGWVERGVTVKPFEEAAFSQKIGEVSEKAITTNFGLHLILVKEKRKEKVRPLEDVAPEISKQLAQEQGRDKLTEVGENLIEANLLGRDLAESAKAYNLSVTDTDFLSASDMTTTLGLSANDAQLLLQGLPIDTLLQAKDAALVVRVGEVKPAKLEPLDQVAGQIKTQLALQKAQSEAVKAGESLLKNLPATLTEQDKNKYKVQVLNGVDRLSRLAPYKPQEAWARAAFAAPLHSWLPKAYAVEQEDGTLGAVLTYVDAITPTKKSDWERVQRIMESGLARETADHVRQIFLQELFKHAKITNVDFAKAERLGI